MSPSKISEKIFEVKDFVGKLSLEQIEMGNRERRMLRIHPCTSGKIISGLEKAENRTAAFLNIMLEDFMKFDPNIRI